MKRILLLAYLLIFMAASQTVASAAGVQASLTPDIAVWARGTQIEGASFSIWGENPQTSFALGLVNGFNDMSKGAALGLFNYSDSYTGFQFGLGVNYTEGDFFGWQMGIFDYTVGSVRGLQTGFVNYAGTLKGLQFGIVNYAANTDTGIQIGLVNIIPRNAWFNRFPDEIAPAMVILNWRF
jgi:hypothetical protein